MLPVLRCVPFYESEHLMEPVGIDGNDQEIEKGRDGSGECTEDGEECATDHVRDPQRDHRVRQQCGDKEDRADQGERVASVMLWRKISSRRLRRTSRSRCSDRDPLAKNLREPEVVGCCIENAVQHDGHISLELGEASSGTGFIAARRTRHPTSEMGQTQTSMHPSATSASPLSTDIVSVAEHIRMGARGASSPGPDKKLPTDPRKRLIQSRPLRVQLLRVLYRLIANHAANSLSVLLAAARFAPSSLLQHH